MILNIIFPYLKTTDNTIKAFSSIKENLTHGQCFFSLLVSISCLMNKNSKMYLTPKTTDEGDYGMDTT